MSIDTGRKMCGHVDGNMHSHNIHKLFDTYADDKHANKIKILFLRIVLFMKQ